MFNESPSAPPSLWVAPNKMICEDWEDPSVGREMHQQKGAALLWRSIGVRPLFP